MLIDCEICGKEPTVALIMGSFDFSSREKALRELRRVHDKLGDEYYFEENMKDKMMWFLVIYNFDGTDEEYKKMFKRLWNGEKIRLVDRKRDVEMNLGYGKYLATRTLHDDVKQYIIYDVKYVKGKHNCSILYDTYHQAWMKLGEWAKQFIPVKDVPQYYFRDSFHVGINCLEKYLSKGF